MRRQTVDNIMSYPVFSIDANKLVKEAVDTMEKGNMKKILVTSKGKPIGVLEKWKITEADYDLKVSQIEPLGKFEIVPRGTELSAVERALINSSAVYVSEPDDQNKLVGVVTSYDLVKTF